MNFTSKKTQLIILAITALILSRIPFFFFNDPEGPNLLVVLGTAVIVYVISLAAYLLYPFKKQEGTKGFPLAIAIQIVVIALFYFCFK